jgi:hypothetical protein
VTRTGALILLAFVAGCVPRSAVERAIAARGGPLPGLVRDSVVQVAAVAFPGEWRWRTVAALPERYAWSVETRDAPYHYLFDGTVVRAFVGTGLVSEDPSATAALRTQARFVAVANLDVLRSPGVQVNVTVAAGGAGATLTAVFADRGDRYEVWIGDDGLVRRVTGPIDMTPVGHGQLVATYDDFAPVDGRRLARHIHYELDGAVLADERVERACVLAPAPPASAFASPAALPVCPVRTP